MSKPETTANVAFNRIPNQLVSQTIAVTGSNRRSVQRGEC